MTAIEHVTLTAGDYVLRPAVVNDAEQALAMLTDPDILQWNPTWNIVDAENRLVGAFNLSDIDRDDQMTATVAYRTAP